MTFGLRVWGLEVRFSVSSSMCDQSSRKFRCRTGSNFPFATDIVRKLNEAAAYSTFSGPKPLNPKISLKLGSFLRNCRGCRVKRSLLLLKSNSAQSADVTSQIPGVSEKLDSLDL